MARDHVVCGPLPRDTQTRPPSCRRPPKVLVLSPPSSAPALASRRRDRCAPRRANENTPATSPRNAPSRRNAMYARVAPRPAPRGFTLIELLVVIAIIAVLIG